MPPKTAEFAAKYISKTAKTNQKKADFAAKQTFLLPIINYIHCTSTSAEKFENVWENFSVSEPK